MDVKLFRTAIALVALFMISILSATALANHDTANVTIVSAFPTSGPGPLNVNFSASGTPSSDPSCATESYTWNFGDGSPPENGSNVNHQFVNPGTYFVTVTYSMQDNHGTASVNCLTGTSMARRTIQVTIPGSISGTKYHDLNANGVRDGGEPGLQGWTITISGPAVQSTMTDFLGEYEFEDLPDGLYSVCETIAGMPQDQQSEPMVGIPCPNGTIGYSLNMQGGTVFEDIDFGNYQNGEIHGRKTVRDPDDPDNNGNPTTGRGDGDCNPDERGCAGVVIIITGTDGMDNPVQREVMTDGNGEFWDMDVKPGSYTVEVREPDGYTCVSPIPCEYEIDLESGQIVTNVDFVDVPDDGGDGGNGSNDEAELNLFINEVMWSGTAASSEDQWIELLNLNDFEIGLDGWRLVMTFEQDDELVEIVIELEGTISSRTGDGNGFFLLEQGDDDVVSDVMADQIYESLLPTTGAVIQLLNPMDEIIDTVNADSGPWPAGQENPQLSMERSEPPTKPELDEHWSNNDEMERNGTDRNGDPIDGTPRSDNSTIPADDMGILLLLTRIVAVLGLGILASLGYISSTRAYRQRN